MANNRLPYGLCKKYGIELPDGATPKDAWEALKKNGIEYIEDKKPREVNIETLLQDEVWPRSVGAKWANEKIKMPDGSTAKFVEGAKLDHKEIIGGFGCRRKIDRLDWLLEHYEPTRTTPRFWSKLKGVSDIILEDGRQIRAEIHWYEHRKVGKREFKYKDDADDESEKD